MAQPGQFATANGNTPVRFEYSCLITVEELETLQTWEDWKSLLLAKEIPTSRIVEGADFLTTELENGDVRISFP